MTAECRHGRVGAQHGLGETDINARDQVRAIALKPRVGRCDHAQIEVAAGAAEVRFLYTPWSWRVGLALMGLGDDTEGAFIQQRAAGQATGVAGRALPEEFRQGLDVYFDALEGKSIE